MTRRTKTLLVSIGGVVVMTLYSAFAALQLLVLNPLAAAPGMSLAEIRAALSAAGESLGEPVVIVLLMICPAVAVATAVIAIRTAARPSIPAMVFLALLVVAGPVLFFASFPPGMALGDTFLVEGSAFLPGVVPLYVVSVAATAMLILGLVVTAVRVRSEPPSVISQTAPLA